MKYLFTLCLLVFSLSASAQWQQTGSKVRYVNGLGIPTRDTAAGVAADSSQILIRPADSALYVKYKRTWLRVGGGGGSIAGSGTTNYIPKFTSSTAIGNSQIFDNGTSVGIGTTSPAFPLDVETSTGRIQFRPGSATGGTSTGTGIASVNSAASALSDLNLRSSIMTFITGSSERMRITSGGNALIGTTTDNGTDRLQVSGNINAINGLLQAGNGTIRNVLTYATEAIVGTTSNHDLILYSNNIDRGRITKGGNILLGTTTDNGTDRLQVSGSASVTSLFGVGTSPSAGTVHIKTTSPSIAIDDNDNAGTAAIRFRPQSASFATRGSIELVSTGSAAPTRFVIASTDTMTFRTNNVERMRVTSAGGNVLISKTTDNGIDKLQVNGSIDAKGFAQAYTTKTGAYTATTSDYLIDCLSGTFTVTLPDALLNVGRILVIKNSGTGTITVDGNGSQTIDGATTYSLSAQWATVQIMCDGGNWKILAKF